MRNWMKFIERQSKPRVAVASVLLCLFIGAFDYATGSYISLSAFYLLPICLAAWFLGARAGLLISLLCTGVWVAGNVAWSDEGFADPFLAVWNALVQLSSFVLVVFVLVKLRDLNRELERRVRERAAALTRESAERERLQQLLLEASEQEQRRIGQDLHDGLGQHLAGTAIAGQVLREKLERQSLQEAGDARKVVELIEEGVSLTRRSVKGLHPVDLSAEGLMFALEEFADTTARLFDVDCRFICDTPVLIYSAPVAENLYRIAQEATRNAVQHGAARHITIELNALDDEYELRIEDDGVGISSSRGSTGGMGMRIMAHRAQAIGARFEVAASTQGGTAVICRFGIETEDQLAS